MWSENNYERRGGWGEKQVKDFISRFELAQKLLIKLSREFGVDKPKLIVKPMNKYHGFYSWALITLNQKTLHDNLAEALRTVRHEFYHYLEDIYNLRQNEFKAKRFEKDAFSTEILPRSQTRLFEEKEENKP